MDQTVGNLFHPGTRKVFGLAVIIYYTLNNDDDEDEEDEYDGNVADEG